MVLFEIIHKQTKESVPRYLCVQVYYNLFKDPEEAELYTTLMIQNIGFAAINDNTSSQS